MPVVYIFTKWEKNFLVSQEDFPPFCLPRQSVVLSILSIRTPSLGLPVLSPWYFSAHVSLSARSLPSSTQSNLGAKGRGSNLSGDIPSAENHDSRCSTSVWASRTVFSPPAEMSDHEVISESVSVDSMYLPKEYIICGLSILSSQKVMVGSYLMHTNYLTKQD